MSELDNSSVLSRHNALVRRIMTYDVTAQELKAGFEDVASGELEIKAVLSKKKLSELAPNGTGGRNKSQVVDEIYNHILGRYVLTSFTWSPFSEKRIDAMRRHVNQTTDEVIQKAKAELQVKLEERKRVLENPESLADIQEYMRLKQIKDADLPSELRQKYDDLIAAQTKATRQAEAEKKAVVQAVELGNTSMQIFETKHTKHGHDLFVVKLSDRVNADTFKDLSQKARLLGGNYSSYARDGAIAGFQFRTKEHAERFMGLKEGDASRQDLQDQRKEEVKENTVDRLRTLAENMTDRAQESLNRDRLDNTVRRANMAASAEEKARSELAMAETLKNLAEAIEKKEVNLLADIRTRADVETLDFILRRAVFKWAEKESKEGRGRMDELRQKPAALEHIDFAEIPYPYAHRETALSLAKQAASVSGAKRDAEKLRKLTEAFLKQDKWVVKGHNPFIREALYNVAIATESLPNSRYEAETVLESFKDFNRLQKMGFVNLPTLRAGLREYIQFRGKKAEADKSKALDRSLIGTKIDGFFPTPKEIVDRLLEAADIRAGETVLEPSAGKGDIADAIKTHEPDAVLSINEVSPTLLNVLKGKGYSEDQVRQGDFLEMKDEDRLFDKIVMNPPFENGQDMDHVQHAFRLLKEGGRVVAIMSEGPFFRSDSKADSFRKWLAEVEGQSEKLPEGSFKDSFRSTGVNTRLVVIDKPQAQKVAPEPEPKEKPIVCVAKAKQLSLF